MKRVLMLLVLSHAALLATTVRADTADLSAPQIAALQGEAFRRAISSFSFGARINKTPLAISDLWLLMDRLEVERRRKPDDRADHSSYSDLIEAICAQGSEADFARLLLIYDALPPDSWLHQNFIEPLSEFRLKREVQALVSTPRTGALSFPHAPIALPEPVKTAPAVLQQAYRAFKTATQPFDWTFKKEGGARAGVSVQESWAAFYAVIGRVLRGDDKGALPELAAFDWGSWCGTGSQAFTGPKYRALLVGLLHERRHQEAVGALFAMQDHRGFSMYDSDADFNRWQQQFLAWCGLDWETLAAGAAVENHPQQLRELAQYGGPRAAEFIAQMALIPSFAERDDYLRAVTAFIKPSGIGTGYGTSSSSDIWRASKEPIPDAQQQQLLQIITARVRPDATRETLETVSHILTELARPETRPTLRTLAQSPYSQVRERVSLALRALGETVTTPPLPSKARFQILLNGKPVSGINVKWEIEMPRPAGATYYTSGVGSSAKTDASGVLEIERDYLVDPRAKSGSLHFSTPSLRSTHEVWFEREMPVPAKLDATTRLDFPTVALTLNLVLPRRVAGETITLKLKAARTQTWGTYFEQVSEAIDLPASGRIVLPRLVPGRYQVEIQAGGAARWESPEIVLERDMEVPATLQAGADLKFEIIAPGEEGRDKNPRFEVLKDGKILPLYQFFDSRSRIYRGLEAGRYVLKIQSSEAKIAEQRQGRNALTSAPTPAYQGREIAFEVNEAAPPLIDLGQVRLQAAEGK